MQAKKVKIHKWLLYYPVLVILCFEVALLILGYRAYEISPYKVETLPSNAFIGDSLLGIQLNPGTYEIILNDSVRFKSNHNSQGLRSTPSQPINAEDQIAMLGCSFTYGYGVNDSETYTALLQSRDSSHIYDNYGVIGYGTIQSYLQLQSLIESGDLAAVILNFSSFHFMRNVMSESYRKNLKLGYANSANNVDDNMKSAQFPFIRDTNLTIEYADWNMLHNNWFGREWSATMNWFQTLYENSKEDKALEIAITTALILEMNRICQSKNIPFGVVCIDNSDETTNLKSQVPRINWIDVNFDFSDANFTHLPYDSHPNQLGHELIANKIESFIQDLTEDE